MSNSQKPDPLDAAIAAVGQQPAPASVAMLTIPVQIASTGRRIIVPGLGGRLT